MVDRCPRCGLRFERIEGHLAGALGVNTALSIVVVLLVGIAGFVLTFPELPVAPLSATVAGVAAVFPVLFYPFSKTVWTAVDLRIRPLESGEVQPGFADWMRP